ncbi:hypothetical protein GF325_07415 [Candidatus Bathyarchaeota archaeon]|nr:hypothetical protein [Candidatus Bathyarchaeota archaeon]
MDSGKSKKLIFTGLDNSGKTSINLMLKQNISSIGLVKPTYLVDRSTFSYLDYEIIQHDFGGQKRYLISYLKEPGKFFNETDLMVFVVDIKDSERFDDAMEYFSNVLERFDDLDLNPSVWVLFHKAEKYLFEADDVEYEATKELERKIKLITDNRYPISFEITSIYDPWSISSSFGKIYAELYPQEELIEETLETLAKELDASVVSIIDDNILPIATHANEKSEEKLVGYTVPYLYRMKKKLDEGRAGANKDIIMMQKGGAGYLFMEIISDPIVIYLLSIGIKTFFQRKEVEKIVKDYTEKIRMALKLDSS